MAKLIFTNREFGGQVYSLITEKTTVGRSASNVLVLRHETVSAQHCEIMVNDPEVIVRDLGSRNGTFVDGVQLIGQRQVKSGQMIRFGQVEARLELGRPADADDGSTDETAIRYHQHAMRDALHPKPAPEPSPQPDFGPLPGTEGATEGQTIMVAKPRIEPIPAATPEPIPVQAHQSSKTTVVIVAGMLVLLVAAAVMWWLRRGN